MTNTIFLTILSLLVSGCTALAAPATTATDGSSSFQLRYFDARGAAEGSRLLFALAGEEYDDERFQITPGKMEAPAFLNAKENGEMVSNLGRAPVLVTPEGATIGQSKAIERFLARKFGVMGRTDVQEAQVDCIAEHCRDVKDAQQRKRFSFFVTDRTDDEKAASQTEWFDTDLPAMLAKIEASLQASGVNATPGCCAIGSAITYADLSIYALLMDGMQGDKEATLRAATDCPVLLEICDTVSNHPNIKEWLAKRPETNF